MTNRTKKNKDLKRPLLQKNADPSANLLEEPSRRLFLQKDTEIDDGRGIGVGTGGAGIISSEGSHFHSGTMGSDRRGSGNSGGNPGMESQGSQGSHPSMGSNTGNKVTPRRDSPPSNGMNSSFSYPSNPGSSASPNASPESSRSNDRSHGRPISPNSYHSESSQKLNRISSRIQIVTDDANGNLVNHDLSPAVETAVESVVESVTKRARLRSSSIHSTGSNYVNNIGSNLSRIGSYSGVSAMMHSPYRQSPNLDGASQRTSPNIIPRSPLSSYNLSPSGIFNQLGSLGSSLSRSQSRNQSPTSSSAVAAGGWFSRGQSRSGSGGVGSVGITPGGISTISDGEGGGASITPGSGYIQIPSREHAEGEHLTVSSTLSQTGQTLSGQTLSQTGQATQVIQTGRGSGHGGQLLKQGQSGQSFLQPIRSSEPLTRISSAGQASDMGPDRDDDEYISSSGDDENMNNGTIKPALASLHSLTGSMTIPLSHSGTNLIRSGSQIMDGVVVSDQLSVLSPQQKEVS
jgi:hypothetical protein